ncbi:MAG: DUF4174 domain-containing protein [Pseudomonadota bacterium]
MTDYIWKNRVLIIFTPDNKHTEYTKQTAILKLNKAGMLERDMVTIIIYADNSVMIDDVTQQQLTPNSFHQYYDQSANEFSVFLIGKDNGVKLRQNQAVTPSDLFELIDAMPMRQHEML